MGLRKLRNNQGNVLKQLLTLIALLPAFTAITVAAPQTAPSPTEKPADTANYLLAPGDLLEISVWKEEGMQQQQILVAPDGNINFPLAGAIMAAGKPLAALEHTIADKLSDYIADPVITVKLLQSTGNTIFVIGKVNKPGQFPANRRIDVLQALSLAGGLTPFADDDSIHILRRAGSEVEVFPFDYDDVLNGEHLEQNIILEAGDTVTVP
ncbi:polysaccharide biosynthesis/export family protein [Methylomicrobium lacus]|uniref:polysaccharide biosynthesis/export family protein n=1 Tax=Methylomicrobium lacus TaxID=136992 RepID=UPI0035A869D1